MLTWCQSEQKFVPSREARPLMACLIASCIASHAGRVRIYTSNIIMKYLYLLSSAQNKIKSPAKRLSEEAGLDGQAHISRTKALRSRKSDKTTCLTEPSFDTMRTPQLSLTLELPRPNTSQTTMFDQSCPSTRFQNSSNSTVFQSNPIPPNLSFPHRLGRPLLSIP